MDRALNPPFPESTLHRVEAHLDRKFERTLAMLVRLQEHRALVDETEPGGDADP